MECMCQWKYWNFFNSWMFYGDGERNGEGNGKFHTVIRIWGQKWFWLLFQSFFLFEPFLFEHSLKSELTKECSKEYEGKIMVQKQWLQLKMAGWANLWCLDSGKTDLDIFTYGPQVILSPRFLSTPSRWNLVISSGQDFTEISPQQKGSREKLCNGTECLCICTLLELLLTLLRKVYIKLLPRMEYFFVWWYWSVHLLQ